MICDSARLADAVQIFSPTTVDEAVDVLAERPDATCLAGGTDLMVEINFGLRRPREIVALRRVEELRTMTSTWIGAGVTHARLEQGPWPALSEAAHTIGSPQIRNTGTIGGNIATASPAGDTLPFLAAADALIVTRSNRFGRREIPWDEFFVGVKKTALERGGIIEGVRLPGEAPLRQGFSKVGPRSAMVIAIVSACVLRWADGRTRVALGAVAPTVMRARRAEEMISAEPNPSAAALTEFQRLVSEEARPITDHRSTERYRRHAVGVVARRILERLL
ncbi:nicotinate dehydrogenase FAD-subunit [bacterium BMS3Abin02]|nr:nicotinate dehydrogenase FAD-subunit [bacterium BMS3Abin02]GBE21205.1 nicotinate dehydrogenase FAD-subunit [bacterium BMS3Bbin01]HDH26287.1 xanthine dehydrogenase family protein subunit M [Actinomycetota bacterium]HDL49402.1 xanthine dehydrogenase family protein subunit M [Actinomycetota bacterium]